MDKELIGIFFILILIGICGVFFLKEKNKTFEMIYFLSEPQKPNFILCNGSTFKGSNQETFTKNKQLYQEGKCKK